MRRSTASSAMASTSGSTRSFCRSGCIDERPPRHCPDRGTVFRTAAGSRAESGGPGPGSGAGIDAGRPAPEQHAGRRPGGRHRRTGAGNLPPHQCPLLFSYVPFAEILPGVEDGPLRSRLRQLPARPRAREARGLQRSALPFLLAPDRNTGHRPGVRHQARPAGQPRQPARRARGGARRFAATGIPRRHRRRTRS